MNGEINEFTFSYFICRMSWDRYTKITINMGPEKVWEASVIRWRLKVYEKIISWRKNGKMKERKAKVQLLGGGGDGGMQTGGKEKRSKGRAGR